MVLSLMESSTIATYAMCLCPHRHMGSTKVVTISVAAVATITLEGMLIRVKIMNAQGVFMGSYDSYFDEHLRCNCHH